MKNAVIKTRGALFFRSNSPDRLAPALLANWRTWMRAKWANAWINQFLRQRKVIDGTGSDFQSRALAPNQLQ